MSGTAAQDDLIHPVYSSEPEKRHSLSQRSVMWSTLVLWTNSGHKHQPNNRITSEKREGRRMRFRLNVGE